MSNMCECVCEREIFPETTMIDKKCNYFFWRGAAPCGQSVLLLPMYVSRYVCIHPFIHPSIYQSTHPPTSSSIAPPSIDLSAHLTIHPSIASGIGKNVTFPK